jgi:hypothetical protein
LNVTKATQAITSAIERPNEKCMKLISTLNMLDCGHAEKRGRNKGRLSNELKLRRKRACGRTERSASMSFLDLPFKMNCVARDCDSSDSDM